MQFKISIIIAVKNERDLLLQTLSNLTKQNYPALEVIVIDGGSKDGTQALLQDSTLKIDKWLSEPDEGISDAFNKGIRLSTGDFINFQGAGDILSHENVLSEIFSDINTKNVLVCGKIHRMSEAGEPLWVAPKYWETPFKKQSLLYKMSLPHQGLFTPRWFFEKFGCFDVACRFAMDYEILLRAYHDFPNVICKDLVVSHWRAGGIGANRTHEVYCEYDRIKRQHKVAVSWILKGIDKWNRFKYRMKKILGYSH